MSVSNVVTLAQAARAPASGLECAACRNPSVEKIIPSTRKTGPSIPGRTGRKAGIRTKKMKPVSATPMTAKLIQ